MSDHETLAASDRAAPSDVLEQDPVATPFVEHRPASDRPIVMRARDEVSGAAMMLEQALSMNLSADRIEQLVALQKKVLDDRARRAFFAALADMQARLTPVPKTKWADMRGWGFWYADLGVMQRHVQPLFADVGLSYRWEPKILREGGTEIAQATCHAGHRDGWQESVSWWSTIDRQTGREANKRSAPAHQESAALTVAMRRSFGAAFGIVTEEDVDKVPDGSKSAAPAAQERAPVAQPKSRTGGGGGGGLVACTAAQADMLVKKLRRAKVSDAEFCAAHGLSNVEDLPKSSVDRAIAWIERQSS